MRVENLNNKKVKYEELKQSIYEKYIKETKRVDKIIKVISENIEIKDNDSFETIIFKKYLEVENVTKVAQYINDLGYRVKTNSYVGERKYIGTDITKILISDVNIDNDLKEVVRDMQDRNYQEMLRSLGW